MKSLVSFQNGNNLLIAPTLSSSPKAVSGDESFVIEKTLLNDTGVGLGDSIGSVLDTDYDDTHDHIQHQGDQGNDGDEPDISDKEDPVVKKKRKPKIHRPCLYCGKKQSALTRHLMTVHKNESEVIKAMALPRKEKNNAFTRLRKEATFKYNMKEMEKGDPCYIRERRKEVNTDDELIVCSECKGWYSKSYKARHQLYCGGNSGLVMIPTIPAKALFINKMPDDFKKMIAKMNVDEVSDVAKTDPIILMVGSRMYNGQKCKTEKIYEVEKRVRLSMRLLSRLYIQFKEELQELSEVKSNDASDMFKITHLKKLIQAIETISAGEDNTIKCGLKVQIQNLIKESGKIIQAHFLVEGKDDDASAVSNFMKVFGVVEKEVFHGALYQLHQKRNKSTRKPANIPDDDVINQLNQYMKMVTSPASISFELPANVFTKVRDATCSRLTVYNGRRGGEPARLFVYQWKEALEGVWLRKETRQLYQKEIDSNNRITFQEGKGNRQVPVFIPPDLVEAMNFLCSNETREESNVPVNNTYVFPSTQGSLNHVSGWHAMMNCCKSANLEGKMNGTMNRHRVSTMIGALGLSESDQELAFQHFGHSGDVNRNIYQVPQAEQQLATTGKYLQQIDNGKDLLNIS